MAGVLSGRRGLIMGVANERSIAWGIAESAYREGADLAFTYAGEMLERRIRPLAARVGSGVVLPCDVQSDGEIENAFSELGRRWGSLDFVVHAVAFAGRDALRGQFLDTSREQFRLALDVSCYSLVAVAREAAILMGDGGSILTLSYLGAVRTLPHYNVMGVAKAGLEAAVRYLAADLGPRGIRVNAISAGPVRTLLAAGVSGFHSILDWYQANSPLRRGTTQEDVGDAALLLLSDWGRAITGEVMYVDGGYNTVAVPPSLKEE